MKRTFIFPITSFFSRAATCSILPVLLGFFILWVTPASAQEKITAANASFDMPEDWRIDFWGKPAGPTNDSFWRRNGKNVGVATFTVSEGLPMFHMHANLLGEEGWRLYDENIVSGDLLAGSSETVMVSWIDGWIYAMAGASNAENPDSVNLIPVFAGYIANGTAFERRYSYTRTDDRGGDIFHQGIMGLIIDGNSAVFYEAAQSLRDPLPDVERTQLLAIADSYTTTVPIAVGKPADSDRDGIPDAIETALGNDPNDNRDASASVDGIDALKANLAAVTADRDSRPTLAEVQDARVGSIILSKDWESGEVSLCFGLQKTDDFVSWASFEGGTWSDAPNGEFKLTLPLGEAKKWLRLTLPE